MADDEPIRIVGYDSGWPDGLSANACFLEDALGD